jgi:predicted nucleic acid-binding protein
LKSCQIYSTDFLSPTLHHYPKLYKLSCYTIVTEEKVYALASDLAIALNHHLFDTFYHAVALHQDIPLITADDKYYRKALGKGRLIHLSDFNG